MQATSRDLSPKSILCTSSKLKNTLTLDVFIFEFEEKEATIKLIMNIMKSKSLANKQNDFLS